MNAAILDLRDGRSLSMTESRSRNESSGSMSSSMPVSASEETEHDQGRERYQLFCAGRHDAFLAAGYHHDVDLPAASAVGMRGRGLIAYFLAAREPGVQVENPRPIAAYNYPPQYGPKTPSF